jgi:hypothetical protein
MDNATAETKARELIERYTFAIDSITNDIRNRKSVIGRNAFDETMSELYAVVVAGIKAGN